jgi:Raf kinase inhibitor-like YbhB/YbcL family protein
MSIKIPVGTRRAWLTAISIGALAAINLGGASADDEQHHHQMTLRSTTFEDGGTLPLSMINTLPDANGQNTCTSNGAAGGNQSPQLSWTQSPNETQSFVVVAYDVTAQFTHWAMYNIPAGTTSLPQNAGTPGSGYGVQNGNDFFIAGYGGPCPPTTLTPQVHKYTFTLYALDVRLPIVATFGNFVPAGPEGLYQELIDASLHGHVLARATIAGYYSAAAPAN